MRKRVYFVAAFTFILCSSLIIQQIRSNTSGSSGQENNSTQSTISIFDNDSDQNSEAERPEIQKPGLPKQHFYETLIGTIGKDRPIQMHLWRFNETLSGVYAKAPVNVNQDYEVRIDGSVDEAGRFSIREFDEHGKTVGTFTGAILAVESKQGTITQLKGEWSSVKGDRQPFFLSEQQLNLPEGLTLREKEVKGESEQGIYWIIAQYPQLKSLSNPLAETFNSNIDGVIETAINNFKRMNKNLDEHNAIGAPLSLDIDYEITAATQDVFSVLLIQNEDAGGAHNMADEAVTLNFDFRTGKLIRLPEMFRPKSDYVKSVGFYCQQYLAESLKRQGEPTGLGEGYKSWKEEDFKNWNITPNGLLLTFDPYEVASYGAGRQQALIPFGKLIQILDPNKSYLYR